MTTENGLILQRQVIKRHLGQVLEKVDTLKETLIPVEKLQSLGIYPVQVGFVGDEINLTPCYFKPLPSSIFEEHPLLEETPAPIRWREL